jgi:hypothetical protein
MISQRLVRKDLLLSRARYLAGAACRSAPRICRIAFF